MAEELESRQAKPQQPYEGDVYAEQYQARVIREEPKSHHPGDVKIRIEKATAQRNIAVFAFIAMCLMTVFLFTGYVTEERILTLESVLNTFYIAMASIVGAFMGFSAWLSRK